MGVIDYVLIVIVAMVFLLALKKTINGMKSGGCGNCNGDCSKCKAKS